MPKNTRKGCTKCGKQINGMISKVIMVAMKGSPSKRLRPQVVLVPEPESDPVEQGLVETPSSESVGESIVSVVEIDPEMLSEPTQTQPIKWQF